MHSSSNQPSASLTSLLPSPRKNLFRDLTGSLADLSKNSKKHIKNLNKFYGDVAHAKEIAPAVNAKPLKEWCAIPDATLLYWERVFMAAYFPDSKAFAHYPIIEKLLTKKPAVFSEEDKKEEKPLGDSLTQYKAALQEIQVTEDNIIGILIISKFLITRSLKAKKSVNPLNVNQKQEGVSLTPWEIACHCKSAAVILLRKVGEIDLPKVEAISRELTALGEEKLSEEIMPVSAAGERRLGLATPKILSIIIPKNSESGEDKQSLSLDKTSSDTTPVVDPLFSPASSNGSGVTPKNSKGHPQDNLLPLTTKITNNSKSIESKENKNSRDEKVTTPLPKKSPTSGVSTATSNFPNDGTPDSTRKKLFTSPDERGILPASPEKSEVTSENNEGHSQANIDNSLNSTDETINDSKSTDSSKNNTSLPNPTPLPGNVQPPPVSTGEPNINLEQRAGKPVDHRLAEKFSSDKNIQKNIEKKKMGNETKRSSTHIIYLYTFQNDPALQANIKKLFAASDSSSTNKSEEIIQCLTDLENALNEVKYPNASTVKIRKNFRAICYAFKNDALLTTKNQTRDILTRASVATEDETIATTLANFDWENVISSLAAIKETLDDPYLKGKEFNGLKAAFYTLIGALTGGLIAAGLGAVALTIGGVAAVSGVSVLITYSLFSGIRGLNKQIREKGQAFVEAVDTAMPATARKNNG
jgi:hypothetical protein